MNDFTTRRAQALQRKWLNVVVYTELAQSIFEGARSTVVGCIQCGCSTAVHGEEYPPGYFCGDLVSKTAGIDLKSGEQVDRICPSVLLYCERPLLNPVLGLWLDDLELPALLLVQRVRLLQCT